MLEEVFKRAKAYELRGGHCAPCSLAAIFEDLGRMGKQIKALLPAKKFHEQFIQEYIDVSVGSDQR